MAARLSHRSRWLAIPVLLLSASCGGDSPAGPPDVPANRPPTIAAIPDQAVVRNTLDPRGVEIALDIDDEDDAAVTVLVDSDAEDVVAGRSFTCVLSDPCLLSFTPAAHRTAVVNLEVTVSDGNGGEARTAFEVSVLPRLVTSASDNDAGSLRQAVAAAEPGDVIGFDTDGHFAQPRTIGLVAQILLDKDLTIEGPGADALAVSGSGAVRVFRVTGGATVLMSGLTITEGHAPIQQVSLLGETILLAAGGGVLVDGASRLELTACVVTANVAQAPAAIAAIGGGIANLEAILIFRDGSISDNTGGGILSFGDGDETVSTIETATVSDNVGSGISAILSAVVVDASTIAGNIGRGIVVSGGNTVIRNGSSVSGNAGGGVSNSGSMTITDSDVNDNTVPGGDARGGGIENTGSLTIMGSRIAGNSADGDVASFWSGGGGLYNDGGATTTITGTVIEDNEATTRGGGIRNHGTLQILADNQIRGNKAGIDGGGIYNDGLDSQIDEADVTISDSVITGNEAAGRGGGIYNRRGTVTVFSDGSVTGNTANAPPPSGGGVYEDGGTLSNAGDISGNTPDDIVP